MTKQDKQLLLKDLCARLPYGVIVQYKQKTFSPYDEYTVDTKVEIDEMLHHRLKLLDFKPYLRPIESMTKKEKREYSKYAHFGNTLSDWTKSIDYLYAHHIDFRGWIKKDLALPALEDMYNI